jgi:hypothetical protein
MKEIMVFASLLLGIIGPTVSLRATPQAASQEIKQSVSKKAKAVAAHAGVFYLGQPRFISIEGTSITYATNTAQEVLHIGNNFYLTLQEVWLVSPSAQGPWRAAPYVPKVVPAIVCSQLNADPFEPYQLCALPWASGLSYSVWKPS